MHLQASKQDFYPQVLGHTYLDVDSESPAAVFDPTTGLHDLQAAVHWMVTPGQH